MHEKSLRGFTFGPATLVKRFDEWAFCDSGIRSMTIPRSVETIGKFCFHACLSLITVTFEQGGRLALIDDHAFSHTDLREIVIPETVQYIGKLAFHSCKLLAMVDFEPKSVLARIAEGAFLECCMNQIRIPPVTNLDRGKIFPDGCILVQEWKPSLAEMFDRSKPTPLVTTPVVAPVIVPNVVTPPGTGQSLRASHSPRSGRDTGRKVGPAASADTVTLVQRRALQARAGALIGTSTARATAPGRSRR
jgi:hypothetical protein